jgi:urease accessory protein
MIPRKMKVAAGNARKLRGERPFVFTNPKSGQGLDTVIRFIETQGLLVR